MNLRLFIPLFLTITTWVSAMDLHLDKARTSIDVLPDDALVVVASSLFGADMMSFARTNRRLLAAALEEATLRGNAVLESVKLRNDHVFVFRELDRIISDGKFGGRECRQAIADGKEHVRLIPYNGYGQLWYYIQYCDLPEDLLKGSFGKLIGEPFVPLSPPGLESTIQYYDYDWEMGDLVACILSHGVDSVPKLFKKATVDGFNQIAGQYYLSREEQSDHKKLGTFIEEALPAEFHVTFKIKEKLHQASQSNSSPKASSSLYRRLLPKLKEIRFEVTEQQFKNAMTLAEDTIKLEYAVRRKELFALQLLVNSNAVFLQSVFRDIVNQVANKVEQQALQETEETKDTQMLRILSVYRYMDDHTKERVDAIVEMLNTKEGLIGRND